MYTLVEIRRLGLPPSNRGNDRERRRVPINSAARRERSPSSLDSAWANISSRARRGGARKCLPVNDCDSRGKAVHEYRVPLS